VILQQVGHPAVAAALNTAHIQHPTAALHAAAKEHKLKVEAELENAEHVKAMASAAAKKVRHDWFGFMADQRAVQGFCAPEQRSAAN
jgi:ABC-type protease/lipase transport system fused ATPase/permease subunit